MIPRVSKGGASFTDAAQYYAFDKNAEGRGMADTSDRVEWVETLNLPIDTTRGTKAEQIEALKKNALVMQWTADHQKDIKVAAGGSSAGRPLAKPAYTYSLSWSPLEQVSKAEMMKAAHESLKALGMDDRQVIILSHTDTHMQHIHCIVNRVHPEHGRAASTSCDRLKLSKWAEDYERRRGAILVSERAKNNAMREASKTGDRRANFNRDAARHTNGNFVKGENLTREERAIITRYATMSATEIRQQRSEQQAADREQLERRHTRRQGMIERELERTYGERRTALTGELEAVQARIGAAGWFRRAIRRVTGHEQRDQATAKHLVKSIASLDQRISDKRSEILKGMEAETTRLVDRHRRERERDETLIAKAKGKAKSDQRAPAQSVADRQSDTAPEAKSKREREPGRTRDRGAQRKAARAEKLREQLGRSRQRDKGRDRGLGD